MRRCPWSVRPIALLAAPALLGLAACGSAPVPIPATVETTLMPNAELALRSSFAERNAEMAKLDRLQVPVARNDDPIVPAELQKVVTFEFKGPLDDGVRALAKTVGYDVVIRAPEHPAPLLVDLNTDPKRIADLFQTLAEAVAGGATVSVDYLHHEVEVVHHG